MFLIVALVLEVLFGVDSLNYLAIFFTIERRCFWVLFLYL